MSELVTKYCIRTGLWTLRGTRVYEDRCRAAGRKRDAHRVLGSLGAFANYGIIRPLSLRMHEKTPRSLAKRDRRVQVE